MSPSDGAEAQASELKIQIQQTTKAETEKQLAITSATKQRESASIAEETATIDRSYSSNYLSNNAKASKHFCLCNSPVSGDSNKPGTLKP